MLGYIVRRGLISIPTLLGISAIIFAILSLAPGDPFAELAMNPNIPADVRLDLRQRFGLDDPLYLRYARWLIAFLQGSWGFSFTSRIDVADLIAQRIPVTLLVMGSAYVLALIVGLLVGAVSALKQYSLLDNVATTLAFLGYSLPTFFTGLLFILLFSVNLRWLPMIYTSSVQAEGLDWVLQSAKNAAMPIAVLALYEAAIFTRYARSSLLEVIRMDYMTTARAKGLPEQRRTLRHALPNALIPIVTIAILQVPALFTGAIVVEEIFRVPGMGSLLITSIHTKDTPVVMAIVFTYSLLMVFFNLVADVLYGVLDPRIRYA